MPTSSPRNTLHAAPVLGAYLSPPSTKQRAPSLGLSSTEELLIHYRRNRWGQGEKRLEPNIAHRWEFQTRRRKRQETTNTPDTAGTFLDVDTDMDSGDVGAVAAPLFPLVGSSIRPSAKGEAVLTTEEVARSTGFFLGGGGFVRNGTAPSPSGAAASAEAALAASFLPVPSAGIIDGGGCEGSHDPLQLRQPFVYAYPPVSSHWSSDSSSRSRTGDWARWPHQEMGTGVEDNRAVQITSVGRDGGNTDARAPGGGVSTERQAKMDALEQELLDRAQRSRGITSTMMAPPLLVTHGMVFPPSRRDLTHLLQDSRRANKAMENISTNPDTLVSVPNNNINKGPTTAIRRRRLSSSQRERPILTTKHSEEQYRHLDIKGLSGGNARAAAGPPTILGTGKKKVGGRCQHPGCSRGSTFGHRGGGKQSVYCVTHKQDGMVKITFRQCARDTCSTAPSYGFQGKRASLCSKHKMPGMINVVTPRCLKDGCGSCASYGQLTERRPLFCARHAHEGMSNVVSRKCLGVGCVKNPSYGHPGDRRASFCVDHHQTGMSNIVSPKCLAPGCGKAPSFGASGDRKPTWCKAHKKKEMINILYSRQLKKVD